MKIDKFLHYINEIVSRETYKNKFFKKERAETKNKKYKDILRTVLKKFFTVKGSSFPKRNIIIPLRNTKKNNLMINDVKIINYLNRNGYSCTKESYNLGQCTNKSGVTESIINVLTQIKSYDVNAEKKKLDNPKVPNIGKQQAKERIQRFNNLDKNLVSYYEEIINKNKQMIVFTWVPRKIASQSTNVGWTSCQNLFSGAYNSYVFPGIGEGAFIAWLVKRGDEFKLDSPIARTVIKVYKDKYGNKLWWPDAVYGTASPLFLERVKDYLREKQVDSVLLSTTNLIATQYNDGTPNIIWDAWTDENIKSKHVVDKYKEILKQQKQTKNELTKTILSKIKDENIKENEAESIFRSACLNNYHELAFKLYKRYNFLPDESVLEDSLNGDKIFNFLIKDKRVKKVSSSLFEKTIKKNNVEAFESVLKHKKIKIEIKDGAHYVNVAESKPDILKVMLKHDDIFTIDVKTCRDLIRYTYGFYIWKIALPKIKTFTQDEIKILFTAAIRNQNTEAIKFLKEELKIDFIVIDEIINIIQKYAKEYNDKATKAYNMREIEERKEVMEIFKKEFPEIYEKIKYTPQFMNLPEERWYVGFDVHALMRKANIENVEDVINKYTKLQNESFRKWHKKINPDWVSTEGILKIINGNLGDSHYISDLIKLMKVMDKKDIERIKEYIKREKIFKDPRLDEL